MTQETATITFNIMVVDDSSIMRSVIGRTIGISGVPVGELFMAENGAEALKALRESWVDLVFADINMPVMDGLTMVEEMQNDDVLCNMPVVVVSTEGSEKKLAKLWDLGIQAFIRKPFTPEKIRKTVQDVLGSWEGENNDISADAF